MTAAAQVFRIARQHLMTEEHVLRLDLGASHAAHVFSQAQPQFVTVADALLHACRILHPFKSAAVYDSALRFIDSMGDTRKEMTATLSNLPYPQRQRVRHMTLDFLEYLAEDENTRF